MWVGWVLDKIFISGVILGEGNGQYCREGIKFCKRFFMDYYFQKIKVLGCYEKGKKFIGF